ncbi:MAG TPA: MFS transporter [Candidatus Sulfotelmatobacter sp.]|nr:MFS transporter [Candidatus Sulfotelmatobacter sp.]
MKSNERTILFGGAATGIFVFGIVMAVLGTLFGMPEMRQRLKIDLAQQGNVFLLLYVGILLATLVAGPVIDSIGNKVILVTSALLVASGMAGFAYAHSFGGAAIPAVLLGLGGGGLNTSTNALVSDLYDEDRGPMLNVLGIFYGIGALGIPLLAAIIAGHLPIARQLLSCAGLAGVCALLFLSLQFPKASRDQSFSWRDVLRVARFPGLLVMGFLLFCESGNEASIAGWTSTYVAETGMGAKAATFILAGYWAALMLGRLLVARMLKFVGKRQLVLASGLGAFAGAAILLATRLEGLLVAGVILIGLSYAGVFPTALAIAGDTYTKMTGTVFGLLFAIALVGGMSFPWAVGQLSQRFGVHYAMMVPLAGAAGICALAGKILWAEKRRYGR